MFETYAMCSQPFTAYSGRILLYRLFVVSVRPTGGDMSSALQHEGSERGRAEELDGEMHGCGWRFASLDSWLALKRDGVDLHRFVLV